MLAVSFQISKMVSEPSGWITIDKRFPFAALHLSPILYIETIRGRISGLLG
jgi:hypothetical protein